MKRIYKSKFLKGVIGFSALSYLGVYLTGYSDEAKYLAGGFYRGMRCAGVGALIANNYLYVNNIYNTNIILARNK
jgi:hypothetical protein